MKYYKRLTGRNDDGTTEECLKWHERAQNLIKDSGGSISGYEKKISDLKEENAQLRARLEKAVELPFSIGDMAYYCQYINGEGYCLIERKIVGIKQIENEPKWWDRREKIMVAVVQGEKDDGEIGEWWYDIGAFGSEWGNDKTVFENQLAELKGDQQ